jgi:hypothetical protein
MKSLVPRFFGNKCKVLVFVFDDVASDVILFSINETMIFCLVHFNSFTILGSETGNAISYFILYILLFLVVGWEISK